MKTLKVPGFGSIKEHRYTTRKQAERKVSAMKKKYGYTPSILEVTPMFSSKKMYVVAEPPGLEPI